MRNAKRLVAAASALFALFALSGCGQSGHWGVDHAELPMCSPDVNDSSAAILVPSGTEIKALEQGTTLRIWHYSNSDELVCVITGKASL